MRFGITRWYSSPQPFLEITEQAFEELKKVRDQSFQALSIQEKYAYVVENYADMEADLLTETLRHNLSSFPDPDEGLTAIHRFSRRIINLFTTTRLYSDQVRQDLKQIESSGAAREQFLAKLSEAYDSSFAYRLCEQLRNYSQHAGIPISGKVIETQHLGTSGQRHCTAAYIKLTLDLPRLLEWPGLKPSVRDELKDISKALDLREVLREYVGLFAKSHQSLIPALKTIIGNGDELLSSHCRRFIAFANDGKEDDSIAAVAERVGQKRETWTLQLAVKERFEYLQGRCGGIYFSDYLFVSGTSPRHLHRPSK